VRLDHHAKNVFEMVTTKNAKGTEELPRWTADCLLPSQSAEGLL